MAFSLTLAALIGLVAGGRLKLFSLLLASAAVAVAASFAHANDWTGAVTGAVGATAAFQIAALAAMLLRHASPPAPRRPVAAPARAEPAPRAGR